MEVSIISELQPPQLPLPLQKMLKLISGKMIYARLNDLECIILYVYLFILLELELEKELFIY